MWNQLGDWLFHPRRGFMSPTSVPINALLSGAPLMSSQFDSINVHHFSHSNRVTPFLKLSVVCFKTPPSYLIQISLLSLSSGSACEYRSLECVGGVVCSLNRPPLVFMLLQRRKAVSLSKSLSQGLVPFQMGVTSDSVKWLAAHLP